PRLSRGPRAAGDATPLGGHPRLSGARPSDVRRTRVERNDAAGARRARRSSEGGRRFMRVPLEIRLRDLPPSEVRTTESLIRELAERLETTASDIVRCHVTVERAQRFQTSGSPYRAWMRVTLPPGHELVSRHEPADGLATDTPQDVVRQ